MLNAPTDPDATHTPPLISSTRTSPTAQNQHQMPVAEPMVPPEGGPLKVRQQTHEIVTIIYSFASQIWGA